MQRKFNQIASFIRKNGKNTNQAKSAWGADRYELGDLTTTLEDDGYTTGIFSKEISARQTAGYPIKFHKGNEEKLDLLWESIFSDE